MILKIETTKFCDQSCLHCPFSRKYSSNQTHVTLGELREQIRDLRSQNKLPKRFEVMLTGGEPLLNPEIFDMIHFLKQSGATTIALATNGLPLVNNEEMKQRLLDSKINELIVSLSTSNSDYTAIRQADQVPVIAAILDIKAKSKHLIITANYLLHQGSLSSLNSLINNLSGSIFNAVRFLFYNQSLAPKQSRLKELTFEQKESIESKVDSHNQKAFCKLNQIKSLFSNKRNPPIILVKFERSQNEDDTILISADTVKESYAS